MILIKNTQRKIKINTAKLKQDAQKILDILGYPDFDLGIWLTTNKTMQKYNRIFRNKDKPTDILSFSYHPELKPGGKIDAKTPEDENLGDLIISLEFVKKDAPRWNMTFVERMPVLLVHGICHLLGYDHVTDEEYQVMRKKEAFLLKHIK